MAPKRQHESSGGEEEAQQKAQKKAAKKEKKKKDKKAAKAAKKTEEEAAKKAEETEVEETAIIPYLEKSSDELSKMDYNDLHDHLVAAKAHSETIRAQGIEEQSRLNILEDKVTSKSADLKLLVAEREKRERLSPLKKEEEFVTGLVVLAEYFGKESVEL